MFACSFVGLCTVDPALLLKLFVQVSSEVCRAFSLCRQGRSAELLTQYKCSSCPPMPQVQRDKQTSAADDDDDSSDNEPDSSQVWCAAACLIVI